MLDRGPLGTAFGTAGSAQTGCSMTVLSEKEIIDAVQKREAFAATIEGGGFSLRIDRYEPALCAAIHNGGNMRSELEANCLLSQAERYYEEDPHTGTFIDQQPITLVAHDSRYEYDLNRAVDECVYETAWGKQVWKNPLSAQDVAQGKEKHARFYRIVSAVVEALVDDFGQCIVYDTHSYNYKRHQRSDLPVFNLGTSSVRNAAWRPVIERWLQTLRDARVEGIEVSAAENDIFYGKGRLAGYCHSRYDEVLVLATEVKKVYMDENSGTDDPVVLPSMRRAYNLAVRANTEAYISTLHK
jgi:N-formylglutamate deformylase